MQCSFPCNSPVCCVAKLYSILVWKGLKLVRRTLWQASVNSKNKLHANKWNLTWVQLPLNTQSVMWLVTLCNDCGGFNVLKLSFWTVQRPKCDIYWQWGNGVTYQGCRLHHYSWIPASTAECQWFIFIVHDMVHCIIKEKGVTSGMFEYFLSYIDSHCMHHVLPSLVLMTSQLVFWSLISKVQSNTRY